MTSFHLIIKGKVQGVFYRASAKQKAKSLGITGWIKNLDNGDVETLITGPGEKLDEFIVWCKLGPSGAVVEDIVIEETKVESFERFVIK